MQQQTNVQVFDKVALIHLDVHTWSGRKKLRPEDIKGNIPPKKLASLGSKRIVDPKRVAVFESLKRRAERLCGAVGVKMMGLYAVPIDKISDLVQALAEIKNEYQESKASFISNYHDDVEMWIAEQMEWGEIIRSAVTPVSSIKDQLQFAWQVFHVQPTGVDDSGLNAEVNGLAGRLFDEISRESMRIFEESFLMRLRVGQRALRQVRAVHEKLNGLAFLDSRASALAVFMADVLNSLPKVGNIEGDHLNKLNGLLVVLSNPSKVTQYGQALLDGAVVTDGELIKLSGFDEDDDQLAEDEEEVTIEVADSDDAAVASANKETPKAPLLASNWGL